MIRVARGAAPAYLQSGEVTREFQRLAAHYRLAPNERGQHRPPRARLGAETLVALSEQFYGKCAYCESTTPGNQLDLFRPAGNASGADGTYPDHYWWLSTEWRNMYLVCAGCCRAKASAFPVDGQRAEIECPYDGLQESALLLDPCSDDPEMTLVYDGSGRILSEDDRSFLTIEQLHLNRRNLLVRRRQEIELVRRQLSGIEGLLRSISSAERSAQSHPITRSVNNQLLELISPQWPYSGARRQVVRSWAGEQEDHGFIDPELRSFLASGPSRATQYRIQEVKSNHANLVAEAEGATLDAVHAREPLFTRTRFIESIELHNIRAFRELRIDCGEQPGDGAPCLMLLGENGCGKTTVLQSVALALMGARERRRLALRPSSFLRQGASEGLIRVKLTGREAAFEVRIREGEKEFQDANADAQVVVMAYGASRRVAKRHRPGFSSHAVRVDNLFSTHTLLASPGGWLRSLEGADAFRRTAISLKQLLPLDAEDEIVQGPPVRVRTRGAILPFDALSAGYRSVLGIAADVMKFVAHVWADRTGGELSAAARGILIVDEVDAHLHPRWKLRLVSDLRELFPQLQLLLTTHDPLTLRGLQRGEVAVLGRGPKGEIRALTDLPSPKSLRIDQLLLSDYFGLTSIRDAETDKELREYQRLLGKEERSEEEERQLSALENQLDAKNLLGTDRRERLLLRSADRYLGQTRFRASSPDRAVEAVEQELAALWAATGRELD